MSTYISSSTASTIWNNSIKKVEKEFDQEVFNNLENHRQKKRQNEEAKKEYLFNPDDLDL